MARIFDRYNRVAAVDSKYTGEEPSWEDASTLNGTQYFKRRSSALNFYNYYCSTKDLMKDVETFAKTNGYDSKIIRSVKSNLKYFSFTAAKLARMINKGMPPTHDGWKEYCEDLPGVNMTEANDDILFVKKEIDRIYKQYTEAQVVDKKDDAPKISVVDRMNNKINDKIIYYLDEMIDNWSATGLTKVNGIDLSSMLKVNDIPVRGLPLIEKWLKSLRLSLENCINKDNEFDTEGWSFLSKPAIKNRIKAIDKMLQQVEKYRGANTKARKPRVKKVKSAEAQVKKLKYKESDDNFGVSSVSPITLPGSKKVLLFNTKNRKLMIYESNGADGFGVKGTTLQNYDENKSYSLTIRKPDDIIPIITNKTERMFTKAIDGLKTKRGNVNGRINEHSIILRTL
jgi:hypothetical protein